jgi:methylmalonyl-CoA mutase C-terminal domain/subunit
MIAKPGLDGHDRGAVVIVQGLRDAGFDLIYTGLRRTPQEIAIAAVQEDVDVLGLSVLSGAHMTILKLIIDELDKLCWRPKLLMAGGIIPKRDEQYLKNIGFDLVFSPGVSMDSIANEIRQIIDHRQCRSSASKERWVQLAMDLTKSELSENDETVQQKGKITVICGQGGVGKSTLIGNLINEGQNANISVAVVASDPSGSGVRGSILADRLRMPMDVSPENYFIRSLPVQDNEIGLSPLVKTVAQKLSLQYDLVIVETIGLGQNQYPEINWADIVVSVVAPGSGDHWQLRKTSSLEVTNMVLVNKADMQQSDQYTSEVIQVLEDSHKENIPPVFKVSQQDKRSISHFLDAIIHF